MIAPQDFLIFPEDRYRLAGGSGPNLTRVRPVEDVDLHERNGVVMVQANNRGVSLWTLKGVGISGMTGWAWRIKKNTALPAKLKLHSDKAEHLMICPTEPMPLSGYLALLETLVVHCEKVFKVKKPGESP